MAVEQADIDPSAAQSQGGACREQGRTDHAGAAAQNPGAAKTALVTVAQANAQLPGKLLATDGLADRR